MGASKQKNAKKKNLKVYDTKLGKVQEIKFNKGAPMRTPDPLESTLLSAVMKSTWILTELTTTIIKLKKDHKGVYLHGGMALALRIAYTPEYLKYINDNGFGEYLTDFQTSDVDLVVRPQIGVKECDSDLEKCIAQNETMQNVAFHMKELRKRIYTRLGSKDNFAKLLRDIREACGDNDAQIVEMPHRTILSDKMLERMKLREVGRVCEEKDFQPDGKGCSALADSYNLTVNVHNEFNDPDDNKKTIIDHIFVLARLAIGVKTNDKIVRVNIFDVSVPKDGDYTYKTNNPTPTIESKGGLPVPGLGYILDSTTTQLRSLQHNDVNPEKQAKLKKRIEMLQVIHNKEHNRNIEHLFELKNRKAALRDMLRQVYLDNDDDDEYNYNNDYDFDQVDIIVDYLVKQTEPMWQAELKNNKILNKKYAIYNEYKNIANVPQTSWTKKTFGEEVQVRT